MRVRRGSLALTCLALMGFAMLRPEYGMSAPAPYPTYVPPSAAPSAATASPSATASGNSLTDLVKRCKPAVVLITTYDQNDQKLELGTGFFVSPTEIITNCHVIEHSSRAVAATSDGETLSILSVTSANRAKDIARLSVQTPQHAITPLKIATSSPEDGEHVMVIGNPIGLEQTVSDGIVSSTRDMPLFGKMLQITAPESPGNSGGPVLNMRGEVVGIVRMQMRDAQNLNFAVPAAEIGSLPPSSSQSLADFNGTLAVGQRSEAVDALKAWWGALDDRSYQTVWQLLSDKSQADMVNSVASSQHLTSDEARSLLEGADGLESSRFWDAFREANHPDEMRGPLYRLRDQHLDTAIVEVSLNSSTDKTMIPYVMLREHGLWKFGHVETEFLNHIRK